MAKRRKKTRKEKRVGKISPGNDAVPAAKTGGIMIRIAVRTDVTDICRLIRSEQEEQGPWSAFTPDYAKALGFIAELLESGIILIAEMEGRVVGSIGVGPQEFWFSRDIFLCDYWTIVHKDYRRTNVANEMFKKLKQFQERVGIPLLIGLFSVVKTQSKMALYRRHFEPMGAVYAQGFVKAGDRP